MNLLLTLTILTLLLLTTPTVIAGVVQGDADRDGVVTLADAIAVARVVVGLERRGSIHPVAADVNCDHKVTMTDALIIAQFVTLGKPLPWCSRHTP